MIHNPKTRRQFLVGSGKTLLTLPFLPSLLPREAWGASLVKAPHFIAIESFNGQWKRTFLPSDSFQSGLTQRASQGVTGGTMTVMGRRLADLTGDISPVLKAFNSYKSQMNILYGFSIPGDGHNAQVVFTGSNNGNTGVVAGAAIWKNSIDQVLARSTSVYPNGIPARNLASLVIADNYDNEVYHSWYQGASVAHSQTTKSLWDNILKNPFGAAGGGTFAPSTTKDVRTRALNAVFADYQNARSPSRNISAVDKQRLDSYMTLLSEVAKELDTTASQPAPVALSCAQPNVAEVNASSNNALSSWNTNFKLVAAAIQCGISNVAALRMRVGSDNGNRDDFHKASHLKDYEDGPNRVLPYQQWVAARIKVLVDELNRLPDLDGTPLLNNSLVLWGNEMGFESYHNHTNEDLPIVTFGSLGGKFRTGEMLRFNSSMGGQFTYAFNSVLESIMHACGATNYPKQTLKNPNGSSIQGFGMQGESWRNVHYVAGPLPYWYNG